MRMIENIKNNLKKSIAIGGISLIGIAALVTVVSDEAQEWFELIVGTKHIHVDEEGKELEEIIIKRDSLLIELNKLNEIIKNRNYKLKGE